MYVLFVLFTACLDNVGAALFLYLYISYIIITMTAHSSELCVDGDRNLSRQIS